MHKATKSGSDGSVDASGCAKAEVGLAEESVGPHLAKLDA